MTDHGEPLNVRPALDEHCRSSDSLAESMQENPEFVTKLAQAAAESFLLELEAASDAAEAEQGSEESRGFVEAGAEAPSIGVLPRLADPGPQGMRAAVHRREWGTEPELVAWVHANSSLAVLVPGWVAVKSRPEGLAGPLSGRS